MAALPRTKVAITISLPVDFLYEFDEYLQENYKTRSGYILDAIKEKMQRDKELEK